MKVKCTFIAEISDEDISESNDVVFKCYRAIEDDFRLADSCDDFNLECEILG